MTNKEKTHSRVKETTVVGLTLSRLLLANKIAQRSREGKRSLGYIGLFVIADIADGVLARRWNVDTPLRRVTDAATDRTSTFVMAKAVYETRPDSRMNLSILAVRELVVGATNAYHFIRTGEVVQGHGVHKLGSLSVAAFGAVANTSSEGLSRAVGVATNVINAGLAIDYISNAINPHGAVNGGVRQIAFNHIRQNTH